MLKIKDGFVVRNVAGETVALPTGDGLNLNMMITLNSTGAFLWEKLQEPTDENALVEALLDKYNVQQDRAQRAVAAFVAQLRENGFLEE